jgi:hypothetical protein
MPVRPAVRSRATEVCIEGTSPQTLSNVTELVPTSTLKAHLEQADLTWTAAATYDSYSQSHG